MVVVIKRRLTPLLLLLLLLVRLPSIVNVLILMVSSHRGGSLVG